MEQPRPLVTNGVLYISIYIICLHTCSQFFSILGWGHQIIYGPDSSHFSCSIFFSQTCIFLSSDKVLWVFFSFVSQDIEDWGNLFFVSLFLFLPADLFFHVLLFHFFRQGKRALVLHLSKGLCLWPFYFCLAWFIADFWVYLLLEIVFSCIYQNLNVATCMNTCFSQYLKISIWKYLLLCSYSKICIGHRGDQRTFNILEIITA